MATELVAFLRARLAEEERIALAVDSAPWWQGESDASGWDRNSVYVGGCNNRVIHDLTEEEADHVALWDPHRILADVAAKRRIIDICQAAADEASGLVAADEIGARLTTEFFGIAVLRHLAQPYAGHPDFDPAWSVSAGVR